MRRVAFLTMDSLEDFVAYDEEAVPPLEQRGWTVDFVPWRTPTDWGRYEAVVIRTPWDYQRDPDAFLAVLDAIEASPARLANPLDVVRWNLDKAYLRDLEARGVPIVPTAWGGRLDDLDALRRRLGSDTLVVKPTVGANADDTFRLGPDTDPSAALATFAARPFMVQPFVRSVIEEGEVSLFHFLGLYSHAILKTPAAGDFRVQEEHGGCIRALSPEPALRAAADRALDGLPPLLYARSDWVRMPEGAPGGPWALMELELIEPSLYFPYDAAAPARFADAFVRWIGGSA
ncbi:MAG: hypothetical protein R3181_08930 [Rubricoccaceae bacterium]|nr:hypothetical protein [Rubricoccaceae bacterium]